VGASQHRRLAASRQIGFRWKRVATPVRYGPVSGAMPASVGENDAQLFRVRECLASSNLLNAAPSWATKFRHLRVWPDR
jgi:hypothetical protein